MDKKENQANVAAGKPTAKLAAIPDDKPDDITQAAAARGFAGPTATPTVQIPTLDGSDYADHAAPTAVQTIWFKKLAEAGNAEWVTSGNTDSSLEAARETLKKAQVEQQLAEKKQYECGIFTFLQRFEE